MHPLTLSNWPLMQCSTSLMSPSLGRGMLPDQNLSPGGSRHRAHQIVPSATTCIMHSAVHSCSYWTRPLAFVARPS